MRVSPVRLHFSGFSHRLVALLRPRVKTIHEFLNYLGAQGFYLVTAELETEGIYTHFYTLQRQVLTWIIHQSRIKIAERVILQQLRQFCHPNTL